MTFSTLDQRGEAIALRDGLAPPLSFSELVREADARAQSLGGRPLVALEMANNRESVFWYLGLVRAGIPTMLFSPGTAAPGNGLYDAFSPDVVVRNGVASAGPGRSPGDPDVHADLALILSTSGSTGSPKGVRLSRANLEANAESIGTYLEIGPGRTAITSLPLHYSYGLSVLNSHLLRGGSVVLTDGSVIEDSFWELAEREQVTDIAGVPFVYELLERRGFRERPLPSLRVMTQAGGRLEAGLVSTYARFARDRGLRFFVMYGQTEATARMAYLPPDQTLEHPDCIGVPIPGGNFELIDASGAPISGTGVPGELVYRGPNVMLGYATRRSELGAGREIHELRTGDIAERTPAGLIRIVGRASRFSKIAGLRIGHDDAERLLATAGFKALVTGDDRAVYAAVLAGDPEKAAESLCTACRLPASAVTAFRIQEVPTLPSGKVDLRALARAGREAHEARRSGPTGDVAGIFARSLGVASVETSASFHELGGDSLAFVEAEAGLQRLLGEVPRGWERMPVGDLAALAEGEGKESKRGGLLQLDFEVPLRLAALSLVFLGHGAPNGKLTVLRGGANILLFLAGYSAARHQFPQYLRGAGLEVLGTTFRRLLLPYLLVVSVLVPWWFEDPSHSWWTLTSTWLIPARDRGALLPFWFLEVMIHCLLITTAVFAVPALRAAAARHPFRAAAGLFAGAIGIMLTVPLYFENKYILPITVDGWLWVYFAGWMSCLARSRAQKLFAFGAIATVALWQYGFASGRILWLSAAVCAVFLVEGIRVRPAVHRVLVSLAANSFFLFLIHPVVLRKAKLFVSREQQPLASMAFVWLVTFALGWLFGLAWRYVSTQVSRMLARYRPAPAGNIGGAETA